MKLNSKVLPHIVKDLNAKSRGLVGYSIHKGVGHTAEISGVYKDLTPWRHAVNLKKEHVLAINGKSLDYHAPMQSI